MANASDAYVGGSGSRGDGGGSRLPAGARLWLCVRRLSSVLSRAMGGCGAGLCGALGQAWDREPVLPALGGGVARNRCAGVWHQRDGVPSDERSAARRGGSAGLPVAPAVGVLARCRRHCLLGHWPVAASGADGRLDQRAHRLTGRALLHLGVQSVPFVPPDPPTLALLLGTRGGGPRVGIEGDGWRAALDDHPHGRGADQVRAARIAATWSVGGRVGAPAPVARRIWQHLRDAARPGKEHW